jgi:1-acyl-sn-glycerol-3-phosphate acyltransferase
VPDDPFNTRSPRAVRAFNIYLRWYLWRNFNAVRVSRAGLPRPPEGRPVIVYSNHPSWWDPLIFILLTNVFLPGRMAFGPMDAAALQRYRFLRRLGVFGIDPSSMAGARQFLAISSQVLSRPEGVLWITAQGGFVDPRQRPIHLRSGIAHLARRESQAVIIPLALEYPFWNERHPEALASFGPAADCGAHHSVAGWAAELETRLEVACSSLAQASMSRDADRFVEILRGRAGVGGVYDFWRRSTAMLAGRRFDASHQGRR